MQSSRNDRPQPRPEQGCRRGSLQDSGIIAIWLRTGIVQAVWVSGNNSSDYLLQMLEGSVLAAHSLSALRPCCLRLHVFSASSLLVLNLHLFIFCPAPLQLLHLDFDGFAYPPTRCHSLGKAPALGPGSLRHVNASRFSSSALLQLGRPRNAKHSSRCQVPLPLHP